MQIQNENCEIATQLHIILGMFMNFTSTAVHVLLSINNCIENCIIKFSM